jgi:hypothetical protein
MTDPRLTTMTGKPVPPDHWAALAWFIIVAGIICYVVSFDVWASISGHRLMTTQFRLWLFSPIIGPFIFGSWIAVFSGLTYHWFLRSH